MHTNNLNLFIQDWNFEQEILKKALKDITIQSDTALVHSTNTYEICCEKCSESKILKSSNPDVILDFVNVRIDHLFIKQ